MADEIKPDPAVAAKPVPPKPAPKPPAVMAAVPWEDELPRKLTETFGEKIKQTSTYLSQNFVVLDPEIVIPVLDYLKRDARFDYLVDITAVDWPKRPERFDLVYILYSFSRNERLRVKVAIPDGSRPQSAVNVHLTANWLEREIFDMFGMVFEGHPDLRRILMPEDWQGHPLRKDYALLGQDQRWVQENVGIESGQ
jgi:NADH-quinone oxidoreductase subunit C